MKNEAGHISTPSAALREAYSLLKPISDKQLWEFENELNHLDYIATRVPKHAKILDAGCGIGLLGVSLALLGYEPQGCDKYVFKEHTQSEVEFLRNVWRQVGFTVQDLDILESTGKPEYDVVTCVAVVEHQPYPKRFIDSLLRYAKDGGYLYLATPNVANGLNRLRVLFGRAPMGNLKPFFLEGAAFFGHWREYTCAEVEKMCVLSGLQIVEARVVQASWPRFNLRKCASLHRGVFQLISRILPGWGDTVRVLARKPEKHAP